MPAGNSVPGTDIRLTDADDADAITTPLGFFLSVASPRTQRPNALIALVYLGAVVLATGVLTLGINLL